MAKVSKAQVDKREVLVHPRIIARNIELLLLVVCRQ